MIRNIDCLSVMQPFFVRALVMLIVLFMAACGDDEPENVGSVTIEEPAGNETAATPSPQPASPPAVVELPPPETAYESLEAIFSQARHAFSVLLVWDMNDDRLLDFADVRLFAQGLADGTLAGDELLDMDRSGDVDLDDVFALQVLVGGDEGFIGLLDSNQDGKVSESDYEIDVPAVAAFALLTGDEKQTLDPEAQASLRLSDGAHPVSLSLSGADTPSWHLVLSSSELFLVPQDGARTTDISRFALPASDADHDFLDGVTQSWSLVIDSEKSSGAVEVSEIVVSLGRPQAMQIVTETALSSQDAVLLPHYIARGNGGPLIPRISASDTEALSFSVLDLFFPVAHADDKDTILKQLLDPKQVTIQKQALTNTRKLTKKLQALVKELDEEEKRCLEVDCKDFERLQKMIRPLVEQADVARILSKGMIARHEQFMKNLGDTNKAIENGVRFQDEIVFAQSVWSTVADLAVMDWSPFLDGTGKEIREVVLKKALKKMITTGSRFGGDVLGGETGKLAAGFVSDVTVLLGDYAPGEDYKDLKIEIDKKLKVGNERKGKIDPKKYRVRANKAIVLAALKVYATKSKAAEQERLKKLQGELSKAISDYQRFARLEGAYRGFHRQAWRLYHQIGDLQAKLEVAEARCKYKRAEALCARVFEQAVSKATQDYDAKLAPKKKQVGELEAKLDKGFDASEKRLKKIRNDYKALRKIREQAGNEHVDISELLTLKQAIEQLDDDIAELRQNQKSNGVDATATISLLAQKKLDYQARIDKLKQKTANSDTREKFEEKQKEIQQLWQEQDKWLENRNTLSEQLKQERLALQQEAAKADKVYKIAVRQAREVFDDCLRKATAALGGDITGTVDASDRTAAVMKSSEGNLLTIGEIFGPLVKTQNHFLTQLKSFKFNYKKIKDCIEKTEALVNKHVEIVGCWSDDNLYMEVLQKDKQILVKSSFVDPAQIQSLSGPVANKRQTINLTGFYNSPELELYSADEDSLLTWWQRTEQGDTELYRYLEQAGMDHGYRLSLKQMNTELQNQLNGFHWRFAPLTTGFGESKDIALMNALRGIQPLVYWIRLGPGNIGQISLMDKTYKKPRKTLKYGEALYVSVEAVDRCPHARDRLTLIAYVENYGFQQHYVHLLETSNSSGVFQTPEQGFPLDIFPKEFTDEYISMNLETIGAPVITLSAPESYQSEPARFEVTDIKVKGNWRDGYGGTVTYTQPAIVTEPLMVETDKIVEFDQNQAPIHPDRYRRAYKKQYQALLAGLNSIITEIDGAHISFLQTQRKSCMTKKECAYLDREINFYKGLKGRVSDDIRNIRGQIIQDELYETEMPTWSEAQWRAKFTQDFPVISEFAQKILDEANKQTDRDRKVRVEHFSDRVRGFLDSLKDNLGFLTGMEFQSDNSSVQLPDFAPAQPADFQ